MPHDDAVLDVIAERLASCEHVNLDNVGAIALALYDFGIRASEFVDDLDQISERAKKFRS